MTAKRRNHAFSLFFSLLVIGAVYLVYQARDASPIEAPTTQAPDSQGSDTQAEVLLADQDNSSVVTGGQDGNSPVVAMAESSERSTDTDRASDQGFVDDGNLIRNGGFEEPSLEQPGTAVATGWVSRETELEFWVDGQDGVDADEGTQFIELNGQFAGRIAQEIELVPGQAYRWSFSHRARNDQDTALALIDGELVTEATSLPGRWRTASGLFIPSAGQRSITFAIEADDEGQFGNFIDNVRFEVQPGL